MGNKQYRKGSDYERKVVNENREMGCIAFRSAGSHSPIDVIVINPVNRTIQLIQCKVGKSYTQKFKESLKEQYSFLNGTFEVTFEVDDGA